MIEPTPFTITRWRCYSKQHTHPRRDTALACMQHHAIQKAKAAQAEAQMEEAGRKRWQIEAHATARREFARHMREQGCTYREIGERFGITARTARAMAIAHPHRPHRNELASLARQFSLLQRIASGD